MDHIFSNDPIGGMASFPGLFSPKKLNGLIENIALPAGFLDQTFGLAGSYIVEWTHRGAVPIFYLTSR